MKTIQAKLNHPTRKIINLSVSCMGEPMLSHEQAENLMGKKLDIDTACMAIKFFKDYKYKGYALSGACYLRRI